MNQVLAFGAFIFGVAGIVTFIIGVFTTNPPLVLVSWIFILTFIVIAFHSGRNDYKERKK
jgi:hypothetical protein